MIHPTAIIDSSVKIEDDVSIGPYSILHGNVRIGMGTKIASNVRIEGNTTIGPGCQIFHGAAIGGAPQDLKFKNEEVFLRIGARNVIREYVTINLATSAGEATIIGNDNLLMAYVHIAHNCVIGNNTILANAVNLAGHITIHDYAILGGMTPVHQFVHIGEHCMVGGASRVSKDVLPYTRVAGNPLMVSGLNSVGLSRRGFSVETIKILKKAYKIIYRMDLNVSQALVRIKSELPQIAEVVKIIEFIENSDRGISK